MRILSALLVLSLLSCVDSQPSPSATFDWDAWREPPVETRPWVRWWWPGNDVEPAELTRELEALAGAFFGGAEIQAFDAALDPEADEQTLARRDSVWSPSFYDHLRVALDAAARLGLRLDLTLGSGWPTGGDFVAAEDSLQTLVWGEHAVTGPAEISLTLDGPDRPSFYQVSDAAAAAGEPLARYLPDMARVVAVVAARVIGGERTTSWADLEDQLLLDPDSLIDLSARVTAGNRLDWSAPVGDWRVIVFYAMPDGEFPNLNAQPEPGFVLDHLDAARVEAALEHLLGDTRAGLSEHMGGALRGVFVDSFELKTERFFADDWLAAFAARRGYDLVPWLPAVVAPGADNSIIDGGGIPTAAPFGLTDKDDRVRRDCRATASELFVSRFMETATAWLAARGLTLKAQAYGLNVDVIRALGAADIPEVEQLYAGGAELFLKLGASAAHLYGRPFASAEAFVWSGRDHANTPATWKLALDKLLAAGITGFVYHGFPYRLAEGFGPTGWSAFSSPWSGLGTFSSHVAEASPFWEDLSALNRYAARMSAALRQGRPEVELAVYYPWYGFPGAFMRLEDHQEPLFNGEVDAGDSLSASNLLMELVTQVFGEPDLGPRGAWLRAMWDLAAELRVAGYAWGWIDADSLRAATVEDGRLMVRGQAFGALLLADLPALPWDLAEHLADLAEAGAPLATLGDLPARQPGGAPLARAEGEEDHEAGDARVGAAMSRLAEGPRVAKVGHEGIVHALRDALEISAGARAEPSHPELRLVRRALDGGGRLVFAWNPTREAAEGALVVGGGCSEPLWLDAVSGEVRSVMTDEAGAAPFTIGPHGSALLMCGVPAPDDALPLLPLDLQSEAPVTGWTLRTGGPEDPPLALGGLPDWRDLPEAVHAAGPGVYEATLTLPALEDGARAALDLGRVDGVAHVRVGDHDLGRRALPPFELPLPADLPPGDHPITITLAAPARNHLTGLALEGDPELAQLAGRADALAPTGLRGPVVLRVMR